jgi:glycosyltransferase involved in cell wall biosynthesis
VKTVALYTDTRGYGGAEVHLLSLAERIDRDRFRPLVMYTPSAGVRPLAERLAKRHLEHHPAPAPLDVRHFGEVLRFAAVLRRLKVDVFHAHKTYPPACRFGLLAAVLARCPVIVSTDQLRFPRAPSRRQRLLLRLVSACMHRHIAVSTVLGRYLAEVLRFRPDKVRVIPNWVDPELFGDRFDGPRVRADLGIAPAAVVIGCVARFDEQKAHADLVGAAAALTARHPSLLFLLVGDGETRPQVQAQVAALELTPRVRFLGQRDDVPALLAATDIVVLPSRWEGLPLSVLEAMASRKPVVATAVDGTAEAVVDGETGILVPPADVGALTAGLDGLIRRPELRAAMGAAGRERVRAHFAAERLVRRTEAVYEETDR